MDVIQQYKHSVLEPQLQSLGLSEQQREIVTEDVGQRLESVLSRWGDASFRRTLLVLGTEEASFWEPQASSLDIRSLVAVAVRNSLIEDLGASHPYHQSLRFRRPPLTDDRIPWITSGAIKFFEGVDLDRIQIEPQRDVFKDFQSRFPNAWHVLSLLGNSADNEINVDLPKPESGPMELSDSGKDAEHHSVVESGIDPRLGDQLLEAMRLVEAGELELFFSPSFKSVTRNPEKLLNIIEHVLRFGGSVLTTNYLLSPKYLARRNPMLRPIHYNSELESQLENMEGLSERHKRALSLVVSGG